MKEFDDIDDIVESKYTLKTGDRYYLYDLDMRIGDMISKAQKLEKTILPIDTKEFYDSEKDVYDEYTYFFDTYKNEVIVVDKWNVCKRYKSFIFKLMLLLKSNNNYLFKRLMYVISKKVTTLSVSLDFITEKTGTVDNNG